MVRYDFKTIMASIKKELEVLKYVASHPRLPLRCKILAGLLVAYALSPIDLIPDFIPVLGQLDDILILPIGIWILYKMVPPEIIKEARARVV
ncbi:YkvA family protein [Methanocella sp. MCL-LM]|uniref:YkvA family protein n=1 Tax=Methanocella sp. MCL-LM TaxID=3412035 RepID=UPI003C796CE8